MSPESSDPGRPPAGDHDPDPLSAVLSDFSAAWDADPGLTVETFCQERSDDCDLVTREALESHRQVLEQLHRVRQSRRTTLPRLETPTPEGDMPPMVGPFPLIRTLGVGGMGTVYLAEQQEPVKRRVALKLIAPGMDSRQVLKRFDTERRALALMEHGHIARVFDAGADAQGRPYFVMEYVDGTPIDRYCSDHRLGLEARLRLFLQVCAGIQHAHQKGILHRDLKPGNLLVTEQEGRATVKIIDFGLARAMDEEADPQTLLTVHGQVLGTPEYMAPEQAGGTSDDLDSRVDIYSLGVILYQLLTDSLPLSSMSLRARGMRGLQERIQQGDCQAPSLRLAELMAGEREDGEPLPGAAWQRKLRGDLDWITLKALEKDRERRYASAAALAEDIQRHLQHEPVLAGPPSGIYRLKKVLRKHRVFFGSLSAIMLSLIVAVVWVLDSNAEVRDALALAQQRGEESRRSTAFLQSYLQTLSDRSGQMLFGSREALRERAGWKEDFEDMPLGTFPQPGSRWTIATDNRDAAIVESQDPGRGRVVRVRGVIGKRDGTEIAIPVCPTTSTYQPEFRLRFLWKCLSDPSSSTGSANVLLGEGNHWRDGSQITVMKISREGRITDGHWSRPEESPLPAPPRGTWHAYEFEFRQTGPDEFRVQAWLDNQFAYERTQTMTSKFQLNRFRWLRFSGGDVASWFDDIEVTYPLSSRPWRRNLDTGRIYALTPEPMTWSEARQWARDRGGDLVTINNAREAYWLSDHYYMADFWVGVEPMPGAPGWRWLAQDLTGEDTQLPLDNLGEPDPAYPGVRAVSSDLLASWTWVLEKAVGKRLGLAEFTREPLTAAAVRIGAGCADSKGRQWILEARSPPQLGCDLELQLGPSRPAQPVFLAIGSEADDGGRWDSVLELADMGAPGCFLFCWPDALMPARADGPGGAAGKEDTSPVCWSLPMPSDVAQVGRRLRLQALIMDPVANDLGIVLSNGLVAQIGHEPLPGDLIQAQSIGGDPLPPRSEPASDKAPMYAMERHWRGVGLAQVQALEEGGWVMAGCFRKSAALGRKFPQASSPYILLDEGLPKTYLARFDSDGKLIWARKIGEGDELVNTDLAVGAGGRIYLAGRYSGEVRIQLQGGRSSMLRSRGARDVFVAALSNKGQVLWVRTLGSTLEEAKPALTVDGEGFIAVAGGHRGALQVGSAPALSRSRGGLDLYLVRFSPDGHLAWAQTGGGPADDQAHDLVADRDGSLVLCGEFRDACAFPSLGGAPHILTARHEQSALAPSSEDIWLARYSRDGERIWLKQAGGFGPDAATCITLGPQGQIHVGGYNKLACRFGEGAASQLIANRGWTDGYVAQFTPSGQIQHISTFQGRWGKDEILTIHAQPDGSVLAAGRFFHELQATRHTWAENWQPVLYNWIRSEVTSNDAGQSEIFLSRIRSDGSVAWLRPAGGRGEDAPTSVTSLSNGSILLAGYCSAPAIFGRAEPNQTMLLLSGTFIALYHR